MISGKISRVGITKAELQYGAEWKKCRYPCSGSSGSTFKPSGRTYGSVTIESQENQSPQPGHCFKCCLLMAGPLSSRLMKNISCTVIFDRTEMVLQGPESQPDKMDKKTPRNGSGCFDSIQDLLGRYSSDPSFDSWEAEACPPAASFWASVSCSLMRADLPVRLRR